MTNVWEVTHNGSSDTQSQQERLTSIEVSQILHSITNAASKQSVAKQNKQSMIKETAQQRKE